MPKRKKAYQRLRGRGQESFQVLRAARYRLWLGADHLLSVRNYSYMEEYKRFHFTDIQALFLRRTPIGKIQNAVLTVCLAVPLAFVPAGIVHGWPNGAILTLAGIAGFFLLLLLINILRGPTCATFLRTAVQIERLYSLHRLRTALKVIGQIRPYVEAVQGAVPPGSEEDLFHNAGFDAPVQPASSEAATLPHYNGRFHEILFYALLLDFAHSCLAFLLPGSTVVLLGVFLSLGLLTGIIGALIRQHGTDIPVSLRVVVWCTLGYLITANALGSLCSSLFALSHPETVANQWNHIQAFAAVSPFESRLRMVTLLYAMTCAFGLALVGLLLLRRFRQTAPAPSPPPLTNT